MTDHLEVPAFNIMASFSQIAYNDWPQYTIVANLFKKANKYQRFQVGITGLSCLKHADTTDRGLTDIQKPIRFPMLNSRCFKETLMKGKFTNGHESGKL